ncbi:MAG: hypothetical protein II453_13245 [Alphaproteobacteria bacterium]|nr:hypothetical protein [Alphaproteobacteria bacterium]MBQ3945778.1 hypothetical protein [Alphaproteobacteria bacterium]
MRKTITLIITLLFIVVSSFGQTTLSTSRCKYIPTYDERQKIKIGDYEFRRCFEVTVEKRCYGKISYSYIYDETEYGASEEINALISHIERNKEYYEEKYKCEIENISIGRDFSGLRCLLLVVIYPDWEEEHNRQQRELANTKNLEREKRLESINW